MFRRKPTLIPPFKSADHSEDSEFKCEFKGKNESNKAGLINTPRNVLTEVTEKLKL